VSQKSLLSDISRKPIFSVSACSEAMSIKREKTLGILRWPEASERLGVITRDF
jgi:hypothetical protein